MVVVWGLYTRSALRPGEWKRLLQLGVGVRFGWRGPRFWRFPPATLRPSPAPAPAPLPVRRPPSGHPLRSGPFGPVRHAYLPYRMRGHLQAQGSSIFFRILYPHPPRVRRFLGKSTFPREEVAHHPYYAPLYIASGLPPPNALSLSTFSYVDNVWKNF